MEAQPNESRQTLLHELERLNDEKWDLLDKLHLNDLARTAIILAIRETIGSDGA